MSGRGSVNVNQSQNRSNLDNSQNLRKSSSNFQKEPKLQVHFWGLPLTDSAQQHDVNYIEFENDRIFEIYPGEGHLFVVTKDRVIYGYGDNSFSQLYKDLPPKVEAPHLVRFPQKIQVAKIFCGCDYTYLLANKGDVYSWGMNIKGQLGLGDFDNRAEPELVSNLSVNAGNPHNSLQSISSLLYENENIVDIGCGSLHCIAISSSSRIFSAGFGATFALGHGDNATINTFKEITFFNDIFNGKKFKIDKVECGVSHSGVLISKKVFIWGLFGKPQTQMSKLPMLINIDCDWTDFIMGDLLTVFLNSKGEVFTIGDNIDGQLGLANDNTVFNQLPKIINLPTKVEYITGGLNHVFAINSSAQKVYAWGSNRLGQINPSSLKHSFKKPIEMDWLYTGKAFAITCKGNSTFYVSKAQLPQKAGSTDVLQSQFNQIQRELIVLAKDKDRLASENQQLKEEITNLNSQLTESNRNNAVQHVSHRSGDTIDEINDSNLMSNLSVQAAAEEGEDRAALLRD